MTDILVEQVIELDEGTVFAWKPVPSSGYTLYKVVEHLSTEESLCVDLSNGEEVTFNPYAWVKIKIEQPS